MKTGIVLEGGAMRGMYTAGVLDVLMENGIYTDGMVGVSAGAVFGCNYKSRQIGRTIRYNTKYCRDPRYASYRSLLFTGNFYNEKFCYHDIPDNLDPFDLDTYTASSMEFYAVVTDVNTGEPVYHLCPEGTGIDLEWMRASASMPLVSRIVKIDGKGYLDGGMSDSIPLKWFQSIGYKHNIVVLTREEGYRKEPTSAMGVIRMMYRKYPKLCDTMAHRHEVYNSQVEYVEKCAREGETLVIRPSVKPDLHRTERDPAKLRALYDIGRADAEERLDEIRDFVG